MASKAQKRPLALQVLLIAILVIWMIAAAFPFFWTLWGSFKVEGDFFSLADWTNVLTGELTTRETGEAFTTRGYSGAWIQEEFWRAAWNSVLVCLFVVTISLTVGTLAGYGLARSGSDLAFWLLILALVFRALPHSVLVAGYLVILALEAVVPLPIWATALILFVIAWVGQFWGHKVEGKKPSFFKDVQFLLIGPAWLLSFLYKRMGIPV